jgi:hypothetical protein
MQPAVETTPAGAHRERPSVCFLIPLLNEAANLPRLLASARTLADELSADFAPRFIIIDDGNRTTRPRRHGRWRLGSTSPHLS